jgi:hypothetical protein
MGLFNNYYGRGNSDRRASNNSNSVGSGRLNNNRNGGGGYQQRQSGLTNTSPTPIDFSVNDIVFDRRTAAHGGETFAAGGGRTTAAVDWRQNDIDFGRLHQQPSPPFYQDQPQRNSCSSDDGSYNFYNGQHRNSPTYSQYNSKPPGSPHMFRSPNSRGGHSPVDNKVPVMGCFNVPPPVINYGNSYGAQLNNMHHRPYSNSICGNNNGGYETHSGYSDNSYSWQDNCLARQERHCYNSYGNSHGMPFNGFQQNSYNGDGVQNSGYSGSDMQYSSSNSQDLPYGGYNSYEMEALRNSYNNALMQQVATDF